MQVLFKSMCSQNKETNYVLQVQNLWKCCQIVHCPSVRCHNPVHCKLVPLAHTHLWGVHSHIILNVLGCFCWLMNVQKKKNLPSVEDRVIKWTTSHQEGKFLNQFQRGGQKKVSDKFRLKSSADTNTRKADVRRTQRSLRVGRSDFALEAIGALRRSVAAQKGGKQYIKRKTILVTCIW